MAMKADLELKISEFQGERGGCWRQERDFWSSLKKDEVAHTQCLRRMGDILLARPD
jgi:hypothetical protein